MKKENLNKIRTVAYRILPAFCVAVAVIMSLAAPASAAGFDYNDYIVSIDNGFVTSSLPTTYTSWLLCGYPSMDEVASGGNPAEFTVDHSQFFLDTSYALVCAPFGVHGIDVTNIPNGSELSFEFDVNVDQPEDSYGSVTGQVTVYYWSEDDEILSNASYDLGAGFFVEGFVFDDFVMDKPAGADHMTIQFYFFGFDLVNYFSGSTVTFSLDEITLVVYGDYSVGNVDVTDFWGSADIFTFDAIEFPCEVYVVENGFIMVDESGNRYTYEFSGTGSYIGLNRAANVTQVQYPVGSSFTMYGESTLYLVCQENLPSNISIFDYTGNLEIFTIDGVSFPCKVSVVEDALYFTYAGSDVVSYIYEFSGTGTFLGVSQIPYDSDVRYPIGRSFTMYGPGPLYLIIEGNIFTPGFKDEIADQNQAVKDDQALIDSAVDVDSTDVNNLFVILIQRLDIPYANVFALFWESALLHDLLLMATIFALFSFILFGKKG